MSAISQIPALYGTTLRSTPSFFIVDDHDYFENDEFDAKVATLPPDDYGLVAAEQTQHLYYPEFLPDQNRPLWLASGNLARLAPNTNGKFGTIRFGNLLEAVLYDCRRYVNYKGKHAKIIPQWTEDWLVARTRAEDTAHFFHAPSLPFAYCSGKLGDWYPDLLDESTGKMGLADDKPGWQHGWFSQHQRLIQAIASQSKRAAVIVEGDMHATAAGKITRSADINLTQPVHTILSRNARDRRCRISLRISKRSIDSVARARYGSGAEANREEWIHVDRCHAGHDDVLDFSLASAATDRGDRHDVSGACLRGGAQGVKRCESETSLFEAFRHSRIKLMFGRLHSS